MVTLLDKVKILLGITDAAKDKVLTLLIDIAKDEAVAFCNLSVYDTRLDSTVCKMVAQNYNRLGAEGISTQNFNGVSETFIDGYSEDIINSLKRYRKARFV